MLVEDDLHSPTVSFISLYSKFCQSIQLASLISNNAHVPSLQAKILANAYTHRGTILLKATWARAAQNGRGGYLKSLGR